MLFIHLHKRVRITLRQRVLLLNTKLEEVIHLQNYHTPLTGISLQNVHWSKNLISFLNQVYNQISTFVFPLIYFVVRLILIYVIIIVTPGDKLFSIKYYYRTTTRAETKCSLQFLQTVPPVLTALLFLCLGWILYIQPYSI